MTKALGTPKDQSTISCSATVTTGTAATDGGSTPTGIHSIELHNYGLGTVFYCSVTVTAAKGIPLYPGQTKIWELVPSNFTFGLICDTGKTATVRRVDYV